VSDPAGGRAQRVLAAVGGLLFTAYFAFVGIGILKGRGWDLLSGSVMAFTATVAVLCWWFVARGGRPEARDRIRVGCLGGVAVGAVGFVAGFVGPMLLEGGAEGGSVLGIFVTGPLGFVLGTAAGVALAGLRARRGAE
jgi:hypothetical protein